MLIDYIYSYDQQQVAVHYESTYFLTTGALSVVVCTTYFYYSEYHFHLCHLCVLASTLECGLLIVVTAYLS